MLQNLLSHAPSVTYVVHNSRYYQHVRQTNDMLTNDMLTLSVERQGEQTFNVILTKQPVFLHRSKIIHTNFALYSWGQYKQIHLTLAPDCEISLHFKRVSIVKSKLPLWDPCWHRTYLLPMGPNALLGDRVLSCCAQTCCLIQPEHDRPRWAWLRWPPVGWKGGGERRVNVK